MTSGSHANDRFSLPSTAKAYRTIGPFGGDSLPKGLLREHRLKEGTWGRLRALSGAIRFVWDDEELEQRGFTVAEGATVIIPPTVPHHLELLGDDGLQLEIDFLEASE